MVKGSKSWGTQQGEAEASGFKVLYMPSTWGAGGIHRLEVGKPGLRPETLHAL